MAAAAAAASDNSKSDHSNPTNQPFNQPPPQSDNPVASTAGSCHNHDSEHPGEGKLIDHGLGNVQHLSGQGSVHHWSRQKFSKDNLGETIFSIWYIGHKKNSIIMYRTIKFSKHFPHLFRQLPLIEIIKICWNHLNVDSKVNRTTVDIMISMF